MITHIVNVVYPRSIRNWMFVDEDTGREVYAQLHTQNKFTSDDVTEENVFDMPTYYFANKDRAQEFARLVSSKNPGTEVYVSAVKSIACTAKPDVVVKTVNEKGVLPE